MLFIEIHFKGHNFSNSVYSSPGSEVDMFTCQYLSLTADMFLPTLNFKPNSYTGSADTFLKQLFLQNSISSELLSTLPIILFTNLKCQ